MFAGVPSLGLDGLSSAADGPEAALTILLPLGAVGLAYVGPITRQTIAAYPNGGGSYTVARENLGARIGLRAAAPLHRVAREIGRPCALDLSHNEPPVVIVPLGEWNVVSERALRFGMRLSPDVYGVYVRLPDANGRDEEGEKKADVLRRLWAEQVDAPAQAAGVHAPHLEVLSSPYRKVTGPLTEYLDRLKPQYPDRLFAVIIPELVEMHWWEWLLHNHRATALKANLLLGGDPRIVVINVPWYLQPAPAGSRDAEAGTIAP